jgi:hypothetical protein
VSLNLFTELNFVGDGGCNTFADAVQLFFHVDDQLMEHALGVFDPFS